MRLAIKILWLAALACGVAAGQTSQNADLAVLLGPVETPNSGGGLQACFGYQVRSTKVGDLYFEVPFVWVVRWHFFDSGPGVLAVDNNSMYFTPGVRFKVPIHQRFAVYAAAGGGGRFYGTDFVSASGNNAFVSRRLTVQGVLDAGGGVDLRLTRLLSLRGEVRDFIRGQRTDKNQVVVGFGLAFHF